MVSQILIGFVQILALLWGGSCANAAGIAIPTTSKLGLDTASLQSVSWCEP